MALTPLHSLRPGASECNVIGRRSFRGTWELTPPDPTGLDGVSVAVGKRAMATPLSLGAQTLGAPALS